MTDSNVRYDNIVVQEDLLAYYLELVERSVRYTQLDRVTDVVTTDELTLHLRLIDDVDESQGAQLIAYAGELINACSVKDAAYAMMCARQLAAHALCMVAKRTQKEVEA